MLPDRASERVRRDEVTSVEVRLIDEGTWFNASIVAVEDDAIVLTAWLELASSSMVSVVLRDDAGEHVLDGVASEVGGRVRIVLGDLTEAAQASLARIRERVAKMEAVNVA